MDIAKVADEMVTEKDVLNFLKFNNEIGELAQKVVNRRVTVNGAKKMGLSVSDQELQDAADAFRKMTRMFEAKATVQWLEAMKTDMDGWEKYLEEQLFKVKVMDTVSDEEKVEAYFKSNKAEFETVELSQIILESMDAGKEAVIMLKEGYDFAELAKDQSMDSSTKNASGYIGFSKRGQLPDLVAAKVFNAKENDILGPFALGENSVAVIKIITPASCKMTHKVKYDIAKKLFEKWRDGQANTMKVEWV